VPIARAEELLSLKVLSMTEDRLQDRIDARNLLRVNADIDLDSVRDNLRLIAERAMRASRTSSPSWQPCSRRRLER